MTVVICCRVWGYMNKPGFTNFVKAISVWP